MINSIKKILLLIMVAISLLGCSQDKNQNQNQNRKGMNIDQYIPEESKTIDRNNYAEKVLESIKHYDSEPIYYYRINKQNCLIEVKINDVVDYKDYELSNIIIPSEIGHILKSGQQTVTVKMYPVGDLSNKDLGLENQPQATKLSDKAKVDISVVTMDNKSKKQFGDERVITTQVSPKEAAGKKYYEFSFTFNADIPYQFEGWSKGKDLRKLNQELVRKKAVEYYEMIGKVHLNKDLDSWLKINFPLEKRIEGMFYVDKQYLEDLVKEFSDDVLQDYTMLPLKNYTLEYMGDGKLLRLRQSSLEENYRGKGALMLEYDEGYYFPGITLYLPEGRDLATQGFMMWK
ncbi:hypothetical protein [Frigoriflavimonas asaccharolytica]|uniref:Lipoprotein n=1 Tax=Frigoriflavimonas asaccharolytica TaxID=2735899 RepID=A0A8J8GE04_9FLAO|nr:hypothetical protein [Frigoriflavimonas asaccharolytica]NRS94102.1 hypothetical protein [Frigoriflavimonas asaccharolytica]